MSKYDFELDLDNENSLSIIIEMINDNSRILEFGPANGRMTRYLSEKKNCLVDIVEIDEEAGAESSRFSNKSFIGSEKGDIEKYNWLKELEDERYDYIVFADVLEHLHNPKEVLEKCRNILKDTGAIIISVPNIAHNSVLIDLINDEFKYNDIGLLDNTHISFFTYKSLVRMVEQAGYKPEIEKATFCKVGENEIKNNYSSIDKNMAKELKKRENADIYQYVFKIKKNSESVICKQLNPVNLDNNYLFECYVKEKNLNYSEDKAIKLKVNLGSNSLQIDLKEFNEIKQLRLDPINANCMIKVKSIHTIVNNEKIELNISSSNGSQLSKNVFLFLTDDPQIILDTIDSNIEKIYFDFELIDYDLTNISKYDHVIKDIIDEKEQNFKAIIKTIEGEKENLQNQIVDLNSRIDNLILDIKEKEEKNNSISCDLDYYKLHYITAMGQREDLKNKLYDVQNMYNIISNSTCWKITKPVRVCLDLIKKILKSNKYTHKMCKGIKYLKNNGIKETVIKINNIKKYDEYAKEAKLTEEERKKQQNTVFSKNIKFSIVVPLYNTPKNFLTEMIDSCIDQTYGNWELCLADGSDKEHSYVGKIVQQYMKKDNRIKYKVLDENRGLSENTNECIRMSTGDYIALFDHDDLLHPSVLYEYMKAICDKNADFIYCDEDKFEDDVMKTFDPHFKPDFAIDNLRGNNYICHFTVFKKDLVDEVGLFRKEFDGSQDHDMVLRLTEKAKIIVHIPKILYHWRVSSNSVASDPYAKPYTIQAGIKAVKEHLDRCNVQGEVESSTIHPNIYRIKYEIKGNPLVSILIPNKDHIEDLSRCITSILKKSTYKNFEIVIVENNSVESETYEYYKSLEQYDNVKVVTYKTDGKFNYSAINNFGFTHCKGEHVIFLNNDT